MNGHDVATYEGERPRLVGTAAALEELRARGRVVN